MVGFFFGISNMEILILVVIGQLWNLLAGYAGIYSFGQQAYIGIGGYTMLVVADQLDLDIWVGLVLAIVVSGLIAIPSAWLLFRLRGGYFAVGTWAIAEVYRLLIANTTALGRGSGRTLQAVFPMARESREVTTYLLALAIGVAALAAVYVFLRSRHGLGLMAIRDSEPGSEATASL